MEEEDFENHLLYKKVHFNHTLEMVKPYMTRPYTCIRKTIRKIGHNLTIPCYWMEYQWFKIFGKNNQSRYNEHIALDGMQNCVNFKTSVLLAGNKQIRLQFNLLVAVLQRAFSIIRKGTK